MVRYRIWTWKRMVMTQQLLFLRVLEQVELSIAMGLMGSAIRSSSNRRYAFMYKGNGAMEGDLWI